MALSLPLSTWVKLSVYCACANKLLAPPPEIVQEVMQVGKTRSILLVFVVSVYVYYNSLDGGFVFDDHRGILTNDDLDSSKTSLWDLFGHDFWGGSMSRVESHKSYRPLTVFTYRVNYYFNELRPYSYHLVNVLLHTYASLLFLSMCRLVVERGGGERFSVWSVFASLLFSVHSVHTEAVSALWFY